jgi:uncharacterized protein YjiK
MSHKSLAFVATLALFATSAHAQIDLSTYTRVGVYNLPVGTVGANELAIEASAVTYNWNTNTLFIAGDEASSIVEVGLNGSLIGSMALSGFSSSSVGDSEGLTYVGNGRFVVSFERNRNASQFTYAAGTTLTVAGLQQVKLGTTIGNIGNEGISYDPMTNSASGNGFLVVKQENPLGLFQTNIDFTNLTATNGSASTVNPTNLFNPSLMGLAALSDLQALSTVAALTGTGDEDNILVLSRVDGRLIEVGRDGQVLSSLFLGLTPSSSLASTADIGHEGVTIDGAGNIYIVNEAGGGSLSVPQLWVYAPSQPIPEPGTFALMAFGLAGLVLRRRQRA